MADKVHFIARLVIEKVVRAEPAGSGRFPQDPPKPRTVGTVASYTIKAIDLDVLKGKINAHVQLVEDDVEPDPADRD